MRNIEIKINKETDFKELYLYGNFIASWDKRADDLEVIIPYAIEQAVELGKEKLRTELKSMLRI